MKLIFCLIFFIYFNKMDLFGAEDISYFQQKIPRDVVKLILMHLDDPIDLLSAGLTCKRLRTPSKQIEDDLTLTSANSFSFDSTINREHAHVQYYSKIFFKQLRIFALEKANEILKDDSLERKNDKRILLRLLASKLVFILGAYSRASLEAYDLSILDKASKHLRDTKNLSVYAVLKSVGLASKRSIDSLSYSQSSNARHANEQEQLLSQIRGLVKKECTRVAILEALNNLTLDQSTSAILIYRTAELAAFKSVAQNAKTIIEKSYALILGPQGRLHNEDPYLFRSTKAFEDHLKSPSYPHSRVPQEAKHFIDGQYDTIREILQIADSL